MKFRICDIFMGIIIGIFKFLEYSIQNMNSRVASLVLSSLIIILYDFLFFYCVFHYFPPAFLKDCILSISLRLTSTLIRLCVFGFVEKDKSETTTNSSVLVYQLNENINNYLIIMYYMLQLLK